MQVRLLLAALHTAAGLQVLWIGNSYTYYNDLPSLVGRLAAADGVELQFDSHTEGGWSWERHANSSVVSRARMC